MVRDRTPMYYSSIIFGILLVAILLQNGISGPVVGKADGIPLTCTGIPQLTASLIPNGVDQYIVRVRAQDPSDPNCNPEYITWQSNQTTIWDQVPISGEPLICEVSGCINSDSRLSWNRDYDKIISCSGLQGGDLYVRGRLGYSGISGADATLSNTLKITCPESLISLSIISAAKADGTFCDTAFDCDMVVKFDQDPVFTDGFTLGLIDEFNNAYTWHYNERGDEEVSPSDFGPNELYITVPRSTFETGNVELEFESAAGRISNYTNFTRPINLDVVVPTECSSTGGCKLSIVADRGFSTGTRFTVFNGQDLAEFTFDGDYHSNVVVYTIPPGINPVGGRIHLSDSLQRAHGPTNNIFTITDRTEFPAMTINQTECDLTTFCPIPINMSVPVGRNMVVELLNDGTVIGVIPHSITTTSPPYLGQLLLLQGVVSTSGTYDIRTRDDSDITGVIYEDRIIVYDPADLEPQIVSASPNALPSYGANTLTLNTKNFNTSLNITLGPTTYSSTGNGITEQYSIAGDNVILTIPEYTSGLPTTGNTSITLRVSESDQRQFNSLFSWLAPVKLIFSEPNRTLNKVDNPINITFVTNDLSRADFNSQYNIVFEGRTYSSGTSATNSTYKKEVENVTITLPVEEYSGGDKPLIIGTPQGNIFLENAFSFCEWTCTWSSCSDGKELLSCNNNCPGFTESKPSGERDCSTSNNNNNNNGGGNSGGNDDDDDTVLPDKTYVTSSASGNIIKVEIDYKSLYGMQVQINELPKSDYLSDGLAYKIYQISASRPNSEIQEGRIYFSVSSDWMSENNVDSSQIRMFTRPSNGGRWERLSIQNNGPNSFIAYTSKFSDFAIVAELEEIEENGGSQTTINSGDENNNNFNDDREEEKKGFSLIWIYVGLGILVVILAAVFLMSAFSKKPVKKTPPLTKPMNSKPDLLAKNRIVIHPHSPLERKPLSRMHSRSMHKVMQRGARPTLEEQANIKKYVDECLVKGFNLLKIREKLLKTGWDKVYVDSTLAQENKKLIEKAKNEVADLHHYVLVCRQKGFTDEKIKNVLIKAGWTEKTITEAMRK